MATTEEVNRLREAPSDEADAMFLRLMIPHHQAAVPMAEAILKETDRPEVEHLAGAIVTSQRAEIKVIQDMLRGMGEEAPVEEPPDGMDSMPGMEHGG